MLLSEAEERIYGHPFYKKLKEEQTVTQVELH